MFYTLWMVWYVGLISVKFSFRRFPPKALFQFARVFNNSPCSKYLIISVKPSEAIHEYKFGVCYMRQMTISLNSVTTRTFYLYRRNKNMVTKSNNCETKKDQCLLNTILSITEKEEGLLHTMWKTIEDEGDLPKRVSKKRRFLTYNRGTKEQYIQEDV